MPSSNTSYKSYFPKRSMSSSVHSFPSPKISPTPASSPSSPSLMSSSFLSNIKDGFGLGVGVSIADRLTSTVFGPRTINVQQIAPINTENCNNVISNYNTSVQSNIVTESLQQDFNRCSKN
jgi:hypothetical protein